MGRLAGRVLVDETRDLINDRAVEECRLRLFPQGTVLFTKSGMSTLLNQRGILGRPAYVVSHIGCAVPSVAVTSEWLYYTLRQVDLGALTQATTLPSLKLSRVAQVEVPLAPLPEQRRIVAKIEALFEQSRTARQALDRIPPLLTKFRQAVLAAAFRGDLTRDWRAQNPEIEPASTLLKRIRVERERRWERDHQSKGKEAPKPPQLSDACSLPTGWTFTTLEPLLFQNRGGIKTGPFGSLLKKHEHQTKGVPVLGIENIRRMQFVPGSKIHIGPKKAHELVAYDARAGDVLISRSGTVGEACVVPQGIGETRISTNLMRVRLAAEGMLPEFFSMLFGSTTVSNQISALCGGSTRDFLNARILRSLVFPLPPLAEQKEILLRVQQAFQFADTVERAIKAVRQRANTIEQSILARAFRGELVSQDLNDEPACTLLDRVRTQPSIRASTTRLATHIGRGKK